MAGRLSVEDRTWFWEQVHKLSANDACWIWTGPRNGNGYGTVPSRLGTGLAHRLSWSLAHEGVDVGDRMICHRCDRPSCVRPGHLFIGTAKDNCHDMIAKGRAGWQR